MAPPRGFSDEEFRHRVRRGQALMADAGLSALLFTTEPEIRYFTGFLTRFWESPTRPWFLVVPADRPPIAVIPSIGAALMEKTWLEDIRTWRSPAPDDDGVTLLADTLREAVPPGGRIGTPKGPESHVRMPAGDFDRLTRAIGPLTIGDDHGIARRLRLVKSDAEIDKIRTACAIAGRAFDRVSEVAQTGNPLDAVFRRFQMLCLEEGADWVPYLAGASQQGGYSDVISPATPLPLNTGDVLMLDTGLIWDGYFCDFDRNFAIGHASATVRGGHARLVDAVVAAAAIARPGRTAADLFHCMDQIVTGGAGGSGAGRLGHGLGMQLTEWPSLIPDDHTVLEPGMVLTLEPGVEVEPGRILVHEENIVVREHGVEFLSTPAGSEIPVLR